MKAFILTALLGVSVAHAAVDLETCTENGRAVHPELCKSLRQVDASNQRQEAERTRGRAAAQRAKERSDAFEEEQAAQRDAEAMQHALTRAEAASEAAQWKRQTAALAQSVAASERDAERQQAAARKACGDDFGKPRVGMALERAKTCLGYTRLVGQVNRKDGVASVYTNERVQLYVMQDKVVAWQALR